MRSWYFLLAALVSSACGNLVCPATPTVTLAPNGSLAFSSLPKITAGDNILVNYSGGALSGWYSLSNGFASTVKGDVTVDKIYAAAFTGASSGGSITDILGSLVKLFVSIVAVTVLGLLLAVAYLITGCIFWCCRCCGKCGGERRQEDRDNIGLLTMVSATVLILFTCIVLAGTVLAFFSNQLFYDSYTDFPKTANSSLVAAKQYGLQTGDQLDTLFCQLNDTGKVGMRAIDDLVRNLNGIIDGAVNPILSRVSTIGDSIAIVSNALQGINSSAATLKVRSQTLNTSVTLLNSNITQLRTQLGCVSTPSLPICSMVPQSNLTTIANFNALPDISGQVNNITRALQNVTLQQSIVNTITSIQSAISGNASAIQSKIQGVINDVLQYQNTTSSKINEVVNKPSTVSDCSDPNSINGIQNCLSYLTGFITPYNNAVYGVGIAICSFALITVVLVVVGVVMGVAGYQRFIRPHERSSLSNCGGIVLLIAVGVTFFFGFLLLVLAAIAFLLSSFMLVGCDAIAGPQYPLLSLPAVQSKVNLFANISLANLLRQCQNDAGIYSALNLDSKLNLTQKLNIEAQIPNLYSTFDSAAKSINFANQSVLLSNARNALDSFANAGITSINYTAFQQQVNASILAFNVSVLTSQLESLRTAIMSNGSIPNGAQAIATINTTIAGLTDLSTNQLPAMQQQVGILGASVSTAQSLAAGAVQNASSLLNDTARALDNFTMYNVAEIIASLNNTYNTVIGYVLQFEKYVVSSALMRAAALRAFCGMAKSLTACGQIFNKVAGCLPVSNVYNGIYSNLCQRFLGGLIEFWWSLGLCVLFFPAVIISAVVTSRFFLKMKFDYPNDIEYIMKPTKAKKEKE